ncbi:MAG TPA: D-Ala-D-Ala carboxypeptidase family metallohydrolase [Cyclobacteriaceae bacterium]|nr:D-Ala-D-Ala carboxypeptidase family metallohydrolase [Cyclobacteriaceae bacterium]
MLTNRSFTKNFTLHEMLTSQTASRMGFTEQFEPSEVAISNLEALCINILQPLRDAIKSPVIVSSGYRCFRVNSIIGGAAKSQHLSGQAADIQDFRKGNEFLLRKIVELKLPFDQLINEFNFDWVHVSYDPDRNRRDVLEAFKDKNFKTRYRPLEI